MPSKFPALQNPPTTDAFCEAIVGLGTIVLVVVGVDVVTLRPSKPVPPLSRTSPAAPDQEPTGSSNRKWVAAEGSTRMEALLLVDPGELTVLIRVPCCDSETASVSCALLDAGIDGIVQVIICPVTETVPSVLT